MATKTKAVGVKRAATSDKTYMFTDNRCIRLAKDTVAISDLVKNNTIELTHQRFVTLMLNVKEIEESLRKLCAAEFVKHQEHIGGGWYVSVTTGFACVDIRKFFQPAFTYEERPTRAGFAIRISEWLAFVDAARLMMGENAFLTEILPCGNHLSAANALECKECYPFRNNPDVMFNSEVM